MNGARVRKALEFVGGATAASSLVEYARFLVDHTHRLLDGETTTVNFIDMHNARAPYIEITPGSPTPHTYPHLFEAFERHIPEHPLIDYYQRTDDGRAVQIADFLSDREFHELGLYREFFRHMGVEKQMAVSLDVEDGNLVGIAVCRSRLDFNPADVEMFDMLRPILLNAFRNVRKLERLTELESVDSEAPRNRGVVSLDGQRRVRFATTGAEEWLAEFFGRAPFGRLPARVGEWVRAGGARPLHAVRGPRRVTIETVSANGNTLLIVSVHDVRDVDRALRELGLTERERSVALHLCEGLQDAEIARALDISVRTVHKHLEHIYDKIGVRSRTAAAVTIRTAVGHR